MASKQTFWIDFGHDTQDGFTSKREAVAAAKAGAASQNVPARVMARTADGESEQVGVVIPHVPGMSTERWNGMEMEVARILGIRDQKTASEVLLAMVEYPNHSTTYMPKISDMGPRQFEELAKKIYRSRSYGARIGQGRGARGLASGVERTIARSKAKMAKLPKCSYCGDNQWVYGLLGTWRCQVHSKFSRPYSSAELSTWKASGSDDSRAYEQRVRAAARGTRGMATGRSTRKTSKVVSDAVKYPRSEGWDDEMAIMVAKATGITDPRTAYALLMEMTDYSYRRPGPRVSDMSEREVMAFARLVYSARGRSR